MRRLKVHHHNGFTTITDLDTGENLGLNNKISKLTAVFGPACYQSKVIIELIPDELEVEIDGKTVIKTKRAKLK
jgi:hypothetical protein